MTNLIHKVVQELTFQHYPSAGDYFAAFLLVICGLLAAFGLVLVLVLFTAVLWPVSLIIILLVLALISMFYWSYLTHRE